MDDQDLLVNTVEHLAAELLDVLGGIWQESGLKASKHWISIHQIDTSNIRVPISGQRGQTLQKKSSGGPSDLSWGLWDTLN